MWAGSNEDLGPISGGVVSAAPRRHQLRGKMEALILVGAGGAAQMLRCPEGPGVGVQPEWEGVERGVPGNPRGPTVLPVPGISVWPSAGAKALV